VTVVPALMWGRAVAEVVELVRQGRSHLLHERLDAADPSLRDRIASVEFIVPTLPAAG
jgi:hypothetical protein